MDFPESLLPIGRPQGLGEFNIADEIEKRFRTGDTVRGQTVELPLPLLTQAQFNDHREHWRTVGLLSHWRLPAAVWIGRASPPPVSFWRYASAPTWSLQPGVLWLVTGISVAAAD
jgi:hypothetical protein